MAKRTHVFVSFSAPNFKKWERLKSMEDICRNLNTDLTGVWAAENRKTNKEETKDRREKNSTATEKRVFVV